MDGMKKHQASLGIKQNTSEAILADLQAARDAQRDLHSALGERTTDVTPAQREADKAGRAFILQAKNGLKIHLGDQWNQAWSQAGFVNHSLKTPRTLPEREALLKSLAEYLAANPAHENPSTQVKLEMTAARAAALHQALSDARNAAMAHRAEQQRLREIRDAAVTQLRKRLRGAISELGQILDKGDSRWLAFGLNRPSAATVPVRPETLALRPVPGLNNTADLLVDWAESPGAERYRVFRRIEGQDDDFVSVDTVSESEMVVRGLPADARVAIRVIAANAAGESPSIEEVLALVN
jgi:hypothetical protein